MGRPRTVYRGKRRYRWVITLILLIAALVIFFAVWLFSYFQKYIVYDKDGLSIVLPFMQTQAPEEQGGAPVYSSGVDAEIVVEELNLDDIDVSAGEGLTAMKACYVPASGVNVNNLAYQGGLLAANGENAMVLQLKTADGSFSYHSGVALADSYGVNGTEDISSAILALDEQGVYLVAEINTLHDDAMALRNMPLALKDSTGAVASDSAGNWLDPYNLSVREYIADIMTELADMGFDEVLLTGVAHPNRQDVVYSKDMTAAPSVGGSVATFALRISTSAREAGLKCSVLCDSSRLRQNTGDAIGQNMDMFFKVFDRVYVQTDASNIFTDMQSLASFLESGAGERTVPIVSGDAPGYDSWCVKP